MKQWNIKNKKKQLTCIASAVFIALLIYDGSNYGYGYADKLILKAYTTILQRRVLCAKSIWVLDDALIDNQIKDAERSFYNTKHITDAQDLRLEGAINSTKHFCGGGKFFQLEDFRA